MEETLKTKILELFASRNSCTTDILEVVASPDFMPGEYYGSNGDDIFESGAEYGEAVLAKAILELIESS